MPLNSVNTNIGAQIALQSLNLTTNQLQASQKRISTGFRVADAADDGAAFAVAQRVRADVGALTTVNQQLGNAKGLIGTSLSALTSISDTVTKANSLLVQIGDQSIAPVQRDQYVAAYKSLVIQVANTVDGATYNGQTLLGTTDGAVPGQPKRVINNETGATSTLSAADVSGFAATLASLIGLTYSRTAGADTFGSVSSAAAQSAAATALSATAGATAFATAQTTIADLLNQTGADQRFLDATITFTSAKIDSLNAGLGALVDTDLSKESATLQALQIRQQLGTQSLSLANQAPQTLLSLFRQ